MQMRAVSRNIRSRGFWCTFPRKCCSPFGCCGRYIIVPECGLTQHFAYIWVSPCMTVVIRQCVVCTRTPEVTFILSVKIRTFVATQNVSHACKKSLTWKFAQSSKFRVWVTSGRTFISPQYVITVLRIFWRENSQIRRSAIYDLHL